MIAVVVSLVAVVLLVLVVVALGMRSMNRRESSLPPERLKEMAEKEGQTHARSTDEFAASEPKMSKFSPDFSPIGEPKQRVARTGQRGKRGVDEWGNPSSDDEDEEFWANIRSDAEEGGFGAGGTVAARKGASRPVERERSGDRPADRPDRSARPAQRRPKREPVAADPNAATVQAPLPQRPAKAPVPAPAAASAGLADLVEPVQRPAVSSADLADQRTMTFAAPTAAPTADVMSILGAGAQAVPPVRPDPLATSGSYPAPRPSLSTNGSYPGISSNGSSHQGSGSFPAMPTASGSFPAASAASSGSFPAVPAAPIHGAPTSDPFPAYNGTADPLAGTWTSPPAETPATTSGSWAASPDILDDPAPASTTPSGSWPAFERTTPQPYPHSYEVRAGWAVADDSDALTGPSPTTGIPTSPGRAVSAYDDVLSAPLPAPSYAAYETGDYAAGGHAVSVPAAWPAPPAGDRGAHGQTYGAPEAGSPAAQQGGRSTGHHRSAPEQEFPDYYR